MTTGYAFVLFDLLKRNGLNRSDYNVVRAGGVLARWEALRGGERANTTARCCSRHLMFLPRRMG